MRRVPYLETYAALIIRNIVLAGGLPRELGITSLLEVTGYDNASIARSLHHDLARYDEIPLDLWSSVAAASLDLRIPPTAKTTYDELEVVEIPFSGSPKIIAMSLKEAMKRARGAGIFVLGGAGLGA